MHSLLERSSLLSRQRDLALADRLPHSLLLLGPEGSGKEAVALELTVALFAEGAADPEVAARKVRALTHPDLYYVCPVERGLSRDGYRRLLDAKAAEPLARVRQPSSVVIPIGDRDDPGLVSVRAIRRFVQMPPFEGRRRVVIVSDAHRMNRSAANALLKTLEEPPPATLLVLCTHQPHLLPSTIPSRCARVPVPAFSEDELVALLRERQELDAAQAHRIAAVAGGNARRALDLLDDQSRELAAWAEDLVGLMVAGRRAELSRAAEKISKGQAPAGASFSSRKGKGKKANADASLSASRDVGMRVLDFVCSDLRLLLRATQGLDIDPSLRDRLPAADAMEGGALAKCLGLLTDARADLGRNHNVGLVLMSSLLEGESMLTARAGESA